jgi:L-fucose isomerase-like protein
MSTLADERLIVTCETDVMGAISMALLSCAARGKDIPFFGEFTVRHPENPNAELLWHCGPFGWSLKKPESKARIFNMKPSFQVKDGTYTIARMDSTQGHYTLLDGKFKTVTARTTFGTYHLG